MPGAVDFLLDRMRAAGDRPALIGGWGSVGYDRLLARIEAVSVSLPKAGIAPGAAVLLCGDFNPETTAWLLALWENGNIVIPVAPSSAERAADFAAIADVAWIVTAAEDRARPGPGRSAHPLYDALRREGAPGLVIFTSGTSGAPKGALHDVRRLLKKFEAPGKDFVTLAFLLFDHIAGVDTLLYCLSNASTIVCPADRAVLPQSAAAVGRGGRARLVQPEDHHLRRGDDAAGPAGTGRGDLSRGPPDPEVRNVGDRRAPVPI
jgi:acyl-CoA synthetase (AMP-forming)/AMP-acid ligase II